MEAPSDRWSWRCIFERHRAQPSAAPDGASGGLSGAAYQRSAPRAPGSIPICSRPWRSSARTMSGAPISPTSRCAAASFTCWQPWTGRADMSWPGGCRTRCTQASVSRRLRKPWPAMARRRSSTPTRAASSPASPSPGACGWPASGSRWTAGAGAWTTSSSSGCGVRSNTRPSICASSPTASRRGPVIGEWIGFYNTERPHSALGGRTPAEAYGGDAPVDMVDKPLRALPTSPQAQQQRKGDRFKGILAA